MNDSTCILFNLFLFIYFLFQLVYFSNFFLFFFFLKKKHCSLSKKWGWEPRTSESRKMLYITFLKNVIQKKKTRRSELHCFETMKWKEIKNKMIDLKWITNKIEMNMNDSTCLFKLFFTFILFICFFLNFIFNFK